MHFRALLPLSGYILFFGLFSIWYGYVGFMQIGSFERLKCDSIRGFMVINHCTNVANKKFENILSLYIWEESNACPCVDSGG